MIEKYCSAIYRLWEMYQYATYSCEDSEDCINMPPLVWSMFFCYSDDIGGCVLLKLCITSFQEIK